MVYHTLDGLRGLTADLQGDSREDADILLTMVETYDPGRQAVVTVAVEGQNPVSVKMKLEPAFVVDEADGVH